MIALGGGGSLARALGEPGGRALIADGLGRVLRGAPLIMEQTLAQWSAPELASVCLWLRDVTVRTCDELGADPSMIRPKSSGPHEWKGLRAWELAHAYLSGTRPSVGDSIEICCHGCLLDMTGALAACAVEVTLLHWGADPEAEPYVVNGGELPATARRRVEEPAPS